MKSKWKASLVGTALCALVIGMSSCNGNDAEIAALRAQVDSLNTRLQAQYQWDTAVVRTMDGWKAVLERLPRRPTDPPELVSPPPPPPKW